MKSKKLFLIIMASLVMTVSAPVMPAFADETATDETIIYTPESVEDLIAAIDTEYPKQADVTAAREAFDALTMAQQVNVKNYAILISAEQTLAEKNSSRPDQSQKKGTRYSFRISEYVSKVTLTVKYTTDSDGDGVMEAPSLTMISPTGASIKILESQETVKSSWYEFSISRSASSATIDVLMAENGTWTIEADNEVFFSLSDYTDKPSYSEVDSNNTTPPPGKTDKDSNKENKKSGSNGLLAIIGLVACVGVLVFLFVMMNKTPSSKPKSESKKKDKGPEKDEEQSEEDFQAEVQRLLADFEKNRDEDPDEEAPVVTEDSRLFESVTAEELAEDDGISSLNGDDYSGRFK